MFGKIASPTTSCIVEREKWGRSCNKLLFFQLHPTYVFVRGEEKQLHPWSCFENKFLAKKTAHNSLWSCCELYQTGPKSFSIMELESFWSDVISDLVTNQTPCAGKGVSEMEFFLIFKFCFFFFHNIYKLPPWFKHKFWITIQNFVIRLQSLQYMLQISQFCSLIGWWM